jgi:hypothetical protein
VLEYFDYFVEGVLEFFEAFPVIPHIFPDYPRGHFQDHTQKLVRIKQGEKKAMESSH